MKLPWCSPINFAETMSLIGRRSPLSDEDFIKEVLLSKTFADNIRDVPKKENVDWEYIRAEMEKELDLAEHDVCKRGDAFFLKLYFVDYYRRMKGKSCEETLRDFKDAELFEYLDEFHEIIGGEAPENFIVDANEMLRNARSAC